MRIVPVVLGVFCVVSAVRAGYAPVVVECAEDAVRLRAAGLPGKGTQRLHPEESRYAAARKAKAVPALHSYLSHNLTREAWGAPLDLLNLTTTPTIGLALAGGGDRAALFDAAVVNALDGRNTSSIDAGLGGILQATTYWSALSGGSWMLGSAATNDFPGMYDMILGGNGSDGWLLEFDVGWLVASLGHPGYAAEVVADLAAKQAAGFPATVGDVWARDIARHFVPGTTKADYWTASTATDHGASVTWSGVRNLSSYQQHEMPFPIILARAYSPSLEDLPVTYSDAIIPLQGTVYEFTPVEFGSFDPQLAHFLPTKYLDTAMVNGSLTSNSCVTNSDNAGWVMGASSNLWRVANLTRLALWTDVVAPVVDLLEDVLGLSHPAQQLDISAVANPFYKLPSAVAGPPYEDEHETQLRLVDSGMDAEVLPLVPLGVPARELDLIIVADATADSLVNTPLGQSVVATVTRTALFPSGTYNFPPLPSTTTTFIAQGLNLRPTFFGCQGTPATLDSQPATATYPFMVYIPNVDPLLRTDTSVFQVAYSDAEASAFLDAGVAIASGGWRDSQGQPDEAWPTCLACAVVERARGKAGVDRTEECGECLERYCWDEVEADGAGARMVKRAKGRQGHGHSFTL